MNESSMNSVKIEIGAIKHPEFGEIWSGMVLDLNLSDKAMADMNSSDFQKLKFALPIVAERVTAFVKEMLDREDARRSERKKAIEAENAALLSDWEARVAEYEAAAAEFKKCHDAWELKKAQAPEGEDFYEVEPTFYRERPNRPHLQPVY